MTATADAPVRRDEHTDTHDDAWSAELAAVMQLSAGLVASPDPSVVFASLAQVCVPTVGDACIVSINSADRDPYAMFWPQLELVAPLESPALADSGPVSADAPAADAVVRFPGRSAGGSAARSAASGLSRRQHIGLDAVFTPFSAARAQGTEVAARPQYEGAFTLILQSGRPSAQQALLAQLLVDRAVALVDRERMGEELASATARADGLETALSSSRVIGMALGVVMERYKLSSTQAFDLVRRMSQFSHLKLRDVADNIVATGEVVLPAGVPVVRPATKLAVPAPPKPRRP